MKPRTPAQRAAASAAMTVLHNDRRNNEQCINGVSHGKPYKGGRCRKCWNRKLAAERVAYAKRKEQAV